MNRSHDQISGAGPASRRRVPAAVLALGGLIVLAQVPIAAADIVNSATAGASHGGVPVTSGVSRQSVPVSRARPAMEIGLAGSLDDVDGITGPSAGDTVSWRVTVENRGNATLTDLRVTAPPAEFSCAQTGTAAIASLAPGEIQVCTGRQPLAQADLDGNGGGDGDIDAVVTVSSAQLPDRTASAAVAVSATPAMRLRQSLASWRRPFPGVYDLNYSLRLENTGTVTLSRIRLADDLVSAVAPYAILARPEISISGFSGTGGANPDYDGAGDVEVTTGDLRLEPGGRGEAMMRIRIHAGPGSARVETIASASAAELAEAIRPDDPAAFEVADSDGDGATDGEETMAADRDGDGTPDAADHDPTGYFYCEADGRILDGGRISVEDLYSGIRQTGTGSSGAITITRDGSDGRYQFHVTAAGRYRLSYTLPPSGIASTSRHPGGRLDVTTMLPASPAVLGSGEAASSGRLADFSAGANPFHVEFGIEAGDPPFFNNNIPLQFCGSPELKVRMETVSGPLLRADGRSQVTYRIAVGASGSERVDEVRITDDLASVFGAGKFRVVSNAIVGAPAGFGATANPFFDGESDKALLTSGGDLAVGEEVIVDLTLLVEAAGGEYANAVRATGLSPLDARSLQPVTADVAVGFASAGGRGELAAEIQADAASIRPGGAVTYTVKLRNDTATAIGEVDLVNEMPAGFAYLAGSARIGGIAREPVQNDRELVWSRIDLPAGGALTLQLRLAAGAAAKGQEFVDRAYVRDPASGAIISDIGEAVVAREGQAVFDCGEILGLVFDDRNRDGYRQQGEPGIAGVVIAAAEGVSVTSGSEGFFRVTCPMIPREAIGTRYAMTLDTDTLPKGYHLTTENPRAVRLERGRTARMNFGAASLRVVTHIVDENSFEAGTTRLKPAALAALAKLLNLLREELSVLRITYLGSADDPLARQRIGAVRTLVERAWNAEARTYALTIETRFPE